jgi:hypothetical protein
MKHPSFLFALLLLVSTLVGGCELIGDIFQAGVWVGAILVIALIAVVVWIAAKVRG